MAEILQGYWQILDRSGKKIILLSPLAKPENVLPIEIKNLIIILGILSMERNPFSAKNQTL